jgi:hypothetical protein
MRIRTHLVLGQNAEDDSSWQPSGSHNRHTDIGEAEFSPAAKKPKKEIGGKGNGANVHERKLPDQHERS